MPHFVLTLDFYVPGVPTRKESDNFRGKKVWEEILTTTNETCVAYFKRVTEDRVPYDQTVAIQIVVHFKSNGS